MNATVVETVPEEAAAERLFRGFVNALGEEELRHAFLRGYRSFPSLRGGSDVDLLVHPEDRARVETAFQETAACEGFHVWQRVRSGFLTRLYAYKFCADAGHVFFDLDLHTSEASYGIPYFDAASLLSHVTDDEGLRRLPLEIEAMVNAIGHLFMGGAIPKKYRNAWATAGSTLESERLLERVVGAADRALIEEHVASGEPAGELDGRAMGARARRRALRRHPLRSIVGFAAFAFGERIKPLFSPRGRFVIFAGTDGSGKTTLVRELLSRIGPRFRDGFVEEHHLRPGVIPQLSALFHGGKPAYSIEDMSDPHRSTPSGFVGSSLRTLYYWLDYLIGYPLRILPRRRRNSLIIYDRWFYDHVIDPRRFRIALGHPLPAFLVRFLARPNRLVVCTAEPKTVLSRKEELAPEEVERQVSEFNAFAARTPRAVLVNTSASVDACVDQIIRALFEGGDR